MGGGKGASILVKILGDDSSLARALTDSDSKLNRFSNKTQEVGQKMMKVGGLMTAGLTVPIAAAGVASFKMAADLQDAMGATEQIYKGASDSVKTWAEKLPSYYGIARGEAHEYANIMGSLLQNLGGLGEEESAKTSARLTELAGDLAAMYGGSTEQAVGAMTSALKGNTEMLDNYGISATAASLKAKALEMGISTGTEVLNDQQKQAAMLAIIWEQTGAAQGQAAREADGASGQMRSLTTEAKNLATDLGAKLLPIGVKVLGFIGKWMDKFTGLDEKTQTIILIVAACVAALGPLVTIIGALVTVVGFLLSPVGLVIAAIALLVAGFVLLYQKNEQFREVVNRVIEVVKGALVEAFHAVVEAARTLWEIVLPKLQEAFAWLVENMQPVIAALGDLLPVVFQRVRDGITTTIAVVQWLVDVFVAGMNFLWPVVQFVWGMIVDQIKFAIDFVAAIIRTVTAVLSGDWSKAWQGIKDAAAAIWGGIVALISGALTGLWNAIKWAVGVIAGAFTGLWNGIKDNAGNALRAVIDLLTGLPARIVNTLGAIGTAAGQIGSTIMQAIGSGLSGAVGWVGDLGGKIWDSVKGAINRGLDGIRNFGVSVLGADLRPFTGLPRLARGVASAAAGMYTVGDRGPENVYLPAGSRVTPAHESSSGGGVTIIANTNASAVDIGRELEWILNGKVR